MGLLWVTSIFPLCTTADKPLLSFHGAPSSRGVGLESDTCRIWNERSVASGQQQRAAPNQEAGLSLGCAASNVASAAGCSRTSSRAWSRLCTPVTEQDTSETPSRTSDTQACPVPPPTLSPEHQAYAHVCTPTCAKSTWTMYTPTCVQLHKGAHTHVYTQTYSTQSIDSLRNKSVPLPLTSFAAWKTFWPSASPVSIL